MEAPSQAQVIEMFHLLFLRVLDPRRPDWFTLKGGANIRYFFDSPRYSNDIDLDFSGRDGWQVAKTVETVLSGKALAMLAQQAKIEIAESSAVEQTDTTLRWKIGLAAHGHQDLIRTKIEFSGRGGESSDVNFDVVPDHIVQSYGLAAPTVRHYGETAAIEQKIAALALRSETKARDIFDLDLLLRQRRTAPSGLAGLDDTHARQAAARALEIPFANFTTEVAPFLDAEIAALYEENDWDQMRMGLTTWLEEIADSGTSQGDET